MAEIGTWFIWFYQNPDLLCVSVALSTKCHMVIALVQSVFTLWITDNIFHTNIHNKTQYLPHDRILTLTLWFIGSSSDKQFIHQGGLALVDQPVSMFNSQLGGRQFLTCCPFCCVWWNFYPSVLSFTILNHFARLPKEYLKILTPKRHNDVLLSARVFVTLVVDDTLYGGRFNIKMLCYQYKNSYYRDKTESSSSAWKDGLYIKQ